jgi:N4-(beta-N-acetylglucosaminyl)-L-asparaginase
MKSRRLLLKGAAVAVSGVALGLTGCKKYVQSKKQNPHASLGLPKVIATWNTDLAAQTAFDTLQNGGSVIDAVENGVKIEEANPNNQSVGFGGLPDREGNVTLDACIMDAFGNAGSVTFLEHIMHPISVARKVMEDTPHVMLSGSGALKFALENGFEKINLLTPESEKVWKDWLIEKNYSPKPNIERHDTIGMLAVDANGIIGGACTTSGLAFKMNGRVGDSPIIGAGLYVDGEIGGAVATGLGELIMKTMGAFLIVELMRQGASPQEACEEAVHRIAKKYGTGEDAQVGYIALTPDGNHGAFSMLNGFNYALSSVGQTTIYDAEPLVKK